MGFPSSLNPKWSVPPTGHVWSGPGSSATDQGSPCESGRSAVAEVPLEACLQDRTGEPCLHPTRLSSVPALEAGCEVRGGDSKTEASFRRKWSFQSGPKIVFSEKGEEEKV